MTLAEEVATTVGEEILNARFHLFFFLELFEALDAGVRLEDGPLPLQRRILLDLHVVTDALTDRGRDSGGGLYRLVREPHAPRQRNPVASLGGCSAPNLSISVDHKRDDIWV